MLYAKKDKGVIMKKVFLVFVLSLFVCACSSQEIVQEQTVEMLYNNAMDEMNAEKEKLELTVHDEDGEEIASTPLN